MMLRYALAICGLSVVVVPQLVVGWGWDVHRLINRSATTHLPQEFALFGQWAAELESLSIAADERKCCVEGESIKHYIDIDDYPEFFSGQLPHTYQGMVVAYGQGRVDGNGVVPWAIEASYLKLVRAFEERDWDGAIVVAADLGHYVGDLHSPLHLTLNYNGQLTGQNGVHARHESEMTSRHIQALEPEPAVVNMIADPLESIFGWIDNQYPGVAIILEADRTARTTAGGSTTSDTYFDAMWDIVGEETAEWIQDASVAVASLWYAAWLEAGSPSLPGSSTALEDDPFSSPNSGLFGYPNPFGELTSIRVQTSETGAAELMVYDVVGRRVRRWTFWGGGGNIQEIAWDGTDHAGRTLATGVYHLILVEPGGRVARTRIVKGR